jgi:hypothetical protein
MAASGDSAAASRPSPGGGGLAWLTGKFIAPDALRPQWPTNQPATQRGGGGRREHDPPATRTVAKGGAQEPHARPASAELRIEVLGAAEVGTRRQECVQGALLASASLPLHGWSWYHLVGNGNHSR